MYANPSTQCPYIHSSKWTISFLKWSISKFSAKFLILNIANIFGRFIRANKKSSLPRNLQNCVYDFLNDFLEIIEYVIYLFLDKQEQTVPEEHQGNIITLP